MNKDLLLNDEDINQLYFANIESQGSISYPENTSNININEDVVSTGTIDLVATNSINLNASIKAEDNIHINGEVHNVNNAIIYSKKDITIQNDSTFSFTGMIYAPNGKVTIKAKNVNITGTIIAKDIDIQAEAVNFNINDYIINNDNSKILSALQLFLGDMNNSGVLDEEDFKMMQCILLGEEYVNLEDKDNNSIPDIFENVEEWKNYIDSDNDGLPDFLEIYLGTDKMLSDTDNDGLSDYIEVMILNTNPCLEDTDENGILDGDEDYDGDGLTNLEELKIGTDMTNVDTDEDGLDDYYEIKTSKTNPLLKDTDGNGVNDGDELFNQEVTLEINNDESVINGVNVELPTQRKNYNVTSIESVMGVDIMSSNVVGLVGEPYNFTTEGDFSEATVTFKINPENLGNTNFEDLAVLWYDEENQSYEILNTQLNEDAYEVSAITTHFSTGLVVDLVAWENAWTDNIYNDQINWDYCDTALVIDCSGSTDSVRSNEIYAAKKFVEGKMSEEKISIIAEDAGITRYWGADRNSNAKDMITVYNDINGTNFNSLTDNKDNLTNVLTMMETIDFGGGNDFNSSLSMAYNNLNNSSSNKIIIFLSDGEDALESIKPIVSTLKQENIKIYTIGFQCGTNGRKILNYMSSETGGKFFEMNDISDLDIIYNTINIEKNMSFSNSDYTLKNSDNDGILDFFEINGLRLANGQFINLNAEYTTPQLNPDCDGDGINDGTEITQFMKLTYLNNIINNKEDELLNRKLFYFALNSYPNNPDSDNDYYMDNVDTQKLHFNAMQIIDERLNDDNSIDGSNPVADNDDYTDGILNTIPIGEGECFKNEYTFTRNTDKKCEFTITPQKNSDYTITISNPNCILSIVGRKSIFPLDISGNQINSINKSTDDIIYNLTLEKNVTYHIYIEELLSINSQYTVCISQDNWVFAPYGGIQNSQNNELINFEQYQDIYFSDEILNEILNEYCYINLGNEAKSLEERLNPNDPFGKDTFYNNCVQDVNYLIDAFAFNEDDTNIQAFFTEDNLMNTLGNAASFIGVILLIMPDDPITKVIGIIATVTGGITASYSVISSFNETDKNQIINAIYNGKYNVVINHSRKFSWENAAKMNLSSPILDMSKHKTFSSWKDNKYIHKYKYGFRSEIEIFNVHKAKQEADGSWDLIW